MSKERDRQMDEVLEELRTIKGQQKHWFWGLSHKTMDDADRGLSNLGKAALIIIGVVVLFSIMGG